MPIFRGSRYEGSAYTAFIDSNGNVRKYVHPKPPMSVESLNGDYSITKKIEGDELDALAAKNNGRERLWWVIAAVSGVFFAFDIENGTDLIVPSQAQFTRLG